MFVCSTLFCDPFVTKIPVNDVEVFGDGQNCMNGHIGGGAHRLQSYDLCIHFHLVFAQVTLLVMWYYK